MCGGENLTAYSTEKGVFHLAEIIAIIKEAIVKAVGLIRVADIIDVIIITMILYYIFSFLKDTRAGQVIKGVVLIFICTQITSWLKLYATNYLFSTIIQIGAVALVVVFQPELRKALSRIGSGSSRVKELFAIDRESGHNRFESYLAIILKATYDLAATKTGALMVFERTTNLGEISATGTPVDAELSIELIKNIFYPKAPLHDGAAIIRDFRIHAAGCVLPLSKNNALSSDLGTRHKAGTGMSEESDAVVIIVSEETGAVSCAIGGMLKRHLSKETLEKLLVNELAPVSELKKTAPVLFPKKKKNA